MSSGIANSFGVMRKCARCARARLLYPPPPKACPHLPHPWPFRPPQLAARRPAVLQLLPLRLVLLYLPLCFAQIG